jgi:hypothetical protein
MRTTVTLDPDVQRLLKDTAHRKGQPFEQVLNDAVRAGLRSAAPAGVHFKQPVFSLGRAKVDLTHAGALATDLEDQGTVAAIKRSR